MGEDEFGISVYYADVASKVIASVSKQSRTEQLWTRRDSQRSGVTIFDIDYVPEGCEIGDTKSFAFTFGPVAKSNIFTVWIGWKDVYYCFQNDDEMQMVISDILEIDVVRVTKIV